MIVREFDQHGNMATYTQGHTVEEIQAKAGHWIANQPRGWSISFERQPEDEATVRCIGADGNWND